MRNNFKFGLPAGTYFIGDPCYCFSHHADAWRYILDQTNCFSTPICSFNNHILLAFSTEYGDGTYFDQNGNKYYVDAGLIGATPIELIENQYQSSLSESGIIKTFDLPFWCERKNGILIFDNIIIDTKYEDDTTL